jgi:hypothetical protein
MSAHRFIGNNESFEMCLVNGEQAVFTSNGHCIAVAVIPTETYLFHVGGYVVARDKFGQLVNLRFRLPTQHDHITFLRE